MCAVCASVYASIYEMRCAGVGRRGAACGVAFAAAAHGAALFIGWHTVAKK